MEKSKRGDSQRYFTHQSESGSNSSYSEEVSNALFKGIEGLLKEFEYIIHIDNNKIIIKEEENKIYYNISRLLYKMKTNNYEEKILLINNFFKLDFFISKIIVSIDKFFLFKEPKLNIKLKFQQNEENQENFKEQFKNINCEYQNLNLKEQVKFQDIDILNTDKYPNFTNFLNKYLIYNGLIFSKFEISQINDLMSSQSQEIISNMINNLSTLLPTDKAIVFTKIIGNHKNESANYVMELDNGYLISGGPTTINIYEIL